MKKLILLCALSASIIAIGSLSIFGQDKRLSSSPQSFRTFFSKFMGAVKRGDKVVVASMSTFPFNYGFDAGDEGKYTRSQFLKHGFKDIFGASPKKFLTETDPLFSRDGNSYTISTNEAAHLVFHKKGTKFYFSDYIVEP